jgi:GNAT superfamily N-acetyltransferase
MTAIRPGREDDVDAIMGVVRRVIAAMREEGIDQWDEIYPDRQVLSTDAREGALFVADDADGLAGILVLNEFQNAEYAAVPWTFVTPPVCVLHRLFVDPGRRNRGIATVMVSFAEQRARELGYRTMRLDAFTRNPAALRLYHRLGYRDAGAVTLRKGVFSVFEKALGGEAP